VVVAGPGPRSGRRPSALVFRGLARSLNAVPGLKRRLGDRPLPAPGCLAVEDLDGLLRGAAGTVTAVRPDRFRLGVLRPG
jgi:hypothetical protein